MKINQHKNTIERSEQFPETTFKIASSAHAFKILSANLYSDPILAIVRELSTNAFDSHVAAGKENVSFDVHLPTSSKHYFRIRDYGTGLSKKDIEQLYTTYFGSNRNNSNQYTGAFGLGSKSPFAYTDMFTVTSYFNKMKYIYSVFKNENDEPSIALLNTESTTDINGIEIQFDIRPEHTTDFSVAADQVYLFFDPKPNILSHSFKSRYDLNPVLKGSNWSLHEKNKLPRSDSNVGVIMGKVYYNASKSHHKIGYDGKLLIYAPIGSCNITPSREELHYDKQTEITVQKLINNAEHEITNKLRNTANKFGSHLEASIYLRKFLSLISTDITRDRIPTTGSNYQLYDINLRNDRLSIYRKNINKFVSILDNRERYVFIYQDVENISQAHRRNLKYWLSLPDQSRKTCRYLIKSDDLSNCVKIFGYPDISISKLSSFVPRKVSNQTIIKQSTIKLLQSFYSGRVAWKSVDGDLREKSIAVPRKRYSIVWLDKLVKSNYYNFYTFAKMLGYNNIYGLPLSRYNTLRQKLNLNDLETELKKFTQNAAEKANEFQRAKILYGSNDISQHILDIIKNVPSKTCSNLVSLTNTEKPIWSESLHQFDIKLKDTPDFFKVFKEKYPLLILDSWTKPKKEDVIEYINFRDGKN